MPWALISDQWRFERPLHIGADVREHQGDLLYEGNRRGAHCDSSAIRRLIAAARSSSSTGFTR
jgi:hypothetical protein